MAIEKKGLVHDNGAGGRAKCVAAAPCKRGRHGTGVRAAHTCSSAGLVRATPMPFRSTHRYGSRRGKEIVSEKISDRSK